MKNQIWIFYGEDKRYKISGDAGLPKETEMEVKI